jgi:hypothetical protein
MDVLRMAAGSALCAMGCLTNAIVGAAMLFVNWRGGLVVLGAALVLGALAKGFDRRKMRAIYGRQRGDQMHEDDLAGQTPLDLAERDLAGYMWGLIRITATSRTTVPEGMDEA